ncbi:hypothetical protein G4B88_017293, partial [Cannabis sativa]
MMKPVATAAAPAAAEAYGVPLVSVVGDFFCVPYPVELIVKKKSHNLFDSKYEALDANGNLYFHVNGSSHNFEKKRVMRDAAVFLPNNLNEDVPNFQIVESNSPSWSYKVYKGETLIAEFKFVFSWENIAKGTKKLALKIYPGVDYAFIVALVVILYENDIT